MLRPLATALGSLAIAAAVASCSDVDKETQITLALESETEIPAELDSFTVRVLSTRTGELRFARDYFPTSGREFPSTLAVIPFDEESLRGPLRIEIEGRKGTTIFLQRQAVISYFKNRNILLAMPLRMACFQFRDCGPNETCAGGQCVPAQVEESAILDYADDLVFGRPGACFDEEACLGTSTEVKVEEDCTFPIPADVPEGRGNVSIRWAAAPARLLGLEAGDAIEGWTRVANDRGRLSKGACDSHFQRRGPDGQLLVPDWAREVYFSAACESKTRARPHCFSQKTLHAGIGAVSPKP